MSSGDTNTTKRGMNTVCRRWIGIAAMTVGLIAWQVPANAEILKAEQIHEWTDRLTAVLSQQDYVNEPKQTEDPTREGEYYFQYPSLSVIGPEDCALKRFNEIYLDDKGVFDCRGIEVGMSLQDALGEDHLFGVQEYLTVLDVNEDEKGFTWLYARNGEPYGVEYICYGREEEQIYEYVLTYVIEQERIESIGLKRSSVSEQQVEQSLMTAQEMYERQIGEVVAQSNQETVFQADDACIPDTVYLGESVSDMVKRIGDPIYIQEINEAGERILVYEGMNIRLGLDVKTGVEIVKGISVISNETIGPRGLQIGMGISQALMLFRCDHTLRMGSEVIYMEGEAYGEPPFAEIRKRQNDESTILYSAQDENGRGIQLEIGIRQMEVEYYGLSYTEEGFSDERN